MIKSMLKGAMVAFFIGLWIGALIAPISLATESGDAVLIVLSLLWGLAFSGAAIGALDYWGRN